MKPHTLNQYHINRLETGSASRVIVFAPHISTITEGLVFDEDFVTVSELAVRIASVHDQVREELIIQHTAHIRGLRKMRNLVVYGSVQCPICCDNVNDSYRCISCHNELCCGCFPQAMAERISKTEEMITYSCPFCRQTFANFDAITPRESDVNPNDISV